MLRVSPPHSYPTPPHSTYLLPNIQGGTCWRQNTGLKEFEALRRTGLGTNPCYSRSDLFTFLWIVKQRVETLASLKN